MVKNIKVSDELHKQLADYKIHDREPFEDVIKRAINGEFDPKKEPDPSDELAETLVDAIVGEEGGEE